MMCVLVFYEGRDAHTHTWMNERERHIYIYILQEGCLGAVQSGTGPSCLRCYWHKHKWLQIRKVSRYSAYRRREECTGTVYLIGPGCNLKSLVGSSANLNAAFYNSFMNSCLCVTRIVHFLINQFNKFFTFSEIRETFVQQFSRASLGHIRQYGFYSDKPKMHRQTYEKKGNKWSPSFSYLADLFFIFDHHVHSSQVLVMYLHSKHNITHIKNEVHHYWSYSYIYTYLFCVLQ